LIDGHRSETIRPYGTRARYAGRAASTGKIISETIAAHPAVISVFDSDERTGKRARQFGLIAGPSTNVIEL